ncbi:glycoside hydrolase family 5 protein [Paenibacillus sinopodophylli]|uniref:glycoside hydrolase family 5 protein n=1 Tax=Paenibacillus sinopodophylli TaxID=1837342 RepID=UPI00110CB2F3|nr:cellulase family glycosylhydrolase [Paenibacillus sinopodophylli]
MNKNEEVSGFLRASGQKLINGDGREIVLRGVGLGSWLLPEGYMWRFPDEGDRPRRIERIIEELVGCEKAAEFWHIYYDRYTSEADIAQMAAEGFNSVRIPINARFLIEEGEELHLRPGRLELLDRAIGWCRKHSLYAVLDLHGAPGGQTGTNIDDSANDLPELFLNDHNRRLTIQLWRLLAERYKDEWIVAGYDLLNEPLPNWFAEYNEQIMPLYRDVVQAIREVDDQHMIILEGAHWATDWSIFEERIDDNLMLQFHKYWNNPDTESIQTFLDKREELDVPIYMGEGGENNCDWFTGAFRLYEDHDISWNFWTWKKLDCTNSPCSVNLPKDWQLLIDYMQGGKLDAQSAERILWAYLDNLAIERCTYHSEVVHALFRRAPVSIPAIFYGYRGAGVSFGNLERVESKTGFRQMDGIDIRFVDSERTVPNFQHMKGESWQLDELLYVRLAASEWLQYEWTVQTGTMTSPAVYSLEIEVRGNHGARLAVTLNDDFIGARQLEDENWHIIRMQTAIQLEGIQKIGLRAEGQSVDILRVNIMKL